MGESISTRAAYGKALAEFGGRSDIYVFDSDLKTCAMSAYFSEKYPERFFNMGIAEANMVNVGAGFATCGATALVHTFAIFATGRVYDQIRNDICYPGLNVKIVGSHAGLTVGEDGATHQALEDINLMRALPGMTIICPCDGNEARLATKAMLDTKGPFYFRTGRPNVDTVTDAIPGYSFEIGKGCQLRDGNDVTIIACGLMVQEALKAADLLAAEGISARVIDMATIKPIDRETIVKAAKETGAIVTAEEHNIIGGLGTAVSEVLTDEILVPLQRVGVNDTFGHSGNPKLLLEHYGLTPENIAENAKKAIARK